MLRHAWTVVLAGLAIGCETQSGPLDGQVAEDSSVTADASPATCPAPLGTPAARAPVSGVEHPLDEVLRIHHLQAKGTHNSYHIAPPRAPGVWDYTHAPLDVQLGAQGVRKVELDLYFDERCGRHEVLHARVIDELTTCALLTDCLQAVREWSDANPGHHPLFLHLEPKGPVGDAEARIEALETEILSVFPRELIVTPDEVRGAHATLAQAIVADGWPTLGASRGRVLLYLDRSDEYRDAYTHGGTSLEGRLAFVASPSTDVPYAGVFVINDPVGSAAQIREVVEAGFLVRTRADADLRQAQENDPSQLEAALASGAHIVTTDVPVPDERFDYFVEIPGGTPSRCNPRTAPVECTSTAIEDPTRLAGEP